MSTGDWGVWLRLIISVLSTQSCLLIHQAARFRHLPTIGIEYLAQGIGHVDAGFPVQLFTGVGDPVATGLAQSFARPGANATGVSMMSLELTAKRLDLLLQLAPNARRIATLQNLSNPSSARQMDPLHAVARATGVKLQVFNAGNSAEVDAQLHAIPWKEVDALLVGTDSLLLLEGAKVAQAVRSAKVPAIFPMSDYHVYGVLMSYGLNLKEVFRRAADYVDKILKGAKPGDLPIEQPTKFELVVNLKTAKALGLKIPDSILLRADEVIR